MPTRRLRARPPRRGFTIIEILVTIAIIGIIAIFVIPNFLDSLHKSKQKRTMADLREVGRATYSWLTDQIGACAAGSQGFASADYGAAIESTALRELLVPKYLADVPRADAWGTKIEYFLKVDDLVAARVMMYRSAGSDGEFASSSYSFGPFVATDYDQDIVWADGNFIRWPVGVSAAGP